MHDEGDTDLSVHAPLPRLAFEQFLEDNPELVAVVAAVHAHGAPSYLVGGPVRDLALGLDPKDLDITSALRPEDFRHAMAGLDGASIYDVGEAHGTTGIAFRRPDGTEVTVEHTTHRTEVYEPGSRVPTVGFGDELHADLARRDFTMNAVAVDLVTGEVVDPHGGLADLSARVLRTPADPVRTMSEDPLRGFRAVRFAALRGFTVHDGTAAAIRSTADRFPIVSVERRRDELLRVVDAGPEATARALAVMDDLGVRPEMMGGLGDRISASELAGASGLHRGDALAALAAGSSDPRAALDAFKVSNARRDEALASVAALGSLALHENRPAFRWAMRRHGAEAMAQAARIERIWSTAGTGAEQAVAEELSFAARPLPVDGRDALAAGHRGRAVGDALRAVERAMCERPHLSAPEAVQILGSLRSDPSSTVDVAVR